MQAIECDGETIDQAIENALRELGVGRDRVEIEILADATRGVFGFGGKPARVRAKVRAPLNLQQPATPVSRETASAPGWPAEGGARLQAHHEAGSSARPRPVAVQPLSPRAVRQPPAPVEDRVVAPPRPTPAVEARATEVLRGILGYLGSSYELVPRTGADGALVIEVTGDSSGLLIGRRGATLDALEYLVNRILARGDDASTPRVMIDVERYRERRQDYLDSLARRLADKAKQSGRVVTLNPMSPRDRRIVHLALHEDEAVATRSQGDGYYRKILILPAQRAGRRPRSPREGA